jgi:hypothetical protein
MPTGTGLVQTTTNGFDLEVSNEDSGHQLMADLAHEASHGADLSEPAASGSLFTEFNVPIAGAQTANGEPSTYEEAHGYMMEYNILSDIFHSGSEATSVMQDQLPHWSGVDQPAWSIQLIQTTFCMQFAGAVGC